MDLIDIYSYQGMEDQLKGVFSKIKWAAPFTQPIKEVLDMKLQGQIVQAQDKLTVLQGELAAFDLNEEIDGKIGRYSRRRTSLE